MTALRLWLTIGWQVGADGQLGAQLGLRTDSAPLISLHLTFSRKLVILPHVWFQRRSQREPGRSCMPCLISFKNQIVSIFPCSVGQLLSLALIRKDARPKLLMEGMSRIVDHIWKPQGHSNQKSFVFHITNIFLLLITFLNLIYSCGWNCKLRSWIRHLNQVQLAVDAPQLQDLGASYQRYAHLNRRTEG